MLSLTSRLLPWLVGIAALALAAAVVVVVVRRGGARRTLALGGGVLALVLLGQALAVTAVALAVNDEYDFYASWPDLFGQGASSNAQIQLGGLVGTGEGSVVVRTVHAHRTGRDDKVVVWLPPQYHQPAYAHRRFPVLMFLPGQPSTPQVAFGHFGFARNASAAIRSGSMPPFIAVFPTLMIAPPRDTECTNVPGGPRAETWLSHDVPAYLTSHFRAAPTGQQWSVMGFSTGAFCATKLLLAHPGEFASAVSLGGYFTPLEDNTTGNLFAGSRRLQHLNSPTWLYHHHGLHGGRLLVVASRQDTEAWPAARHFLLGTGGDPRVSSLLPNTGGHNYRDYSRLMPQMLVWSGRSWRGVGSSAGAAPRA